jgi:hypothetical protein
MPAGFRLHQTSAPQVDAVRRVRLKAFYAAEGKELVVEMFLTGRGKIRERREKGCYF